MRLAFEIKEFKEQDRILVKEFTDQQIGVNYYTLEDLFDVLKKSLIGEMCFSYILWQANKVKGVRFTYPPGNWTSGKSDPLYNRKWPHPLEETAYFQSLFVSEEIQGKGWGKKLSLVSIKELKKIKAKGIVCHSWKESPENSSFRYLNSLGFQWIGDHPHYWSDVDYICPRCGKPCVCTAQEMYLPLREDGK